MSCMQTKISWLFLHEIFVYSGSTRNYGQPFVTLFFAAFPAALKASTSKMDAMPAGNGPPGAAATLYEVLFAGMLASNDPLA